MAMAEVATAVVARESWGLPEAVALAEEGAEAELRAVALRGLAAQASEARAARAVKVIEAAERLVMTFALTVAVSGVDQRASCLAAE
eukprot:scaffold294180_cov27-Tisochrysis_lutea.AAC.3